MKGYYAKRHFKIIDEQDGYRAYLVEYQNESDFRYAVEYGYHDKTLYQHVYLNYLDAENEYKEIIKELLSWNELPPEKGGS